MTPQIHPPTANEVREVIRRTDCGMTQAKRALEARENSIEFAVEYVERCGLAAVMPMARRYPKWTAYLKQRSGLV